MINKFLSVITLATAIICAVLMLPEMSKAQDEKQNLAYSAQLLGDEVNARISIEFETEPEYQIRYLANPYRIIVDLPNTKFGFEQTAMTPRGIVADIRFGRRIQNHSRMILTMKDAAVLENLELQTTDEKLFRLILDVSKASTDDFSDLLNEQDWSDIGDNDNQNVAQEQSPASKKPRLTPEKASAFTIVLDAGHGGIDGGAEGKNGAIEKKITLDMAKDLAQELKKIGDFNIILTREDDRFISLGTRVRIARQNNADLLLSIHADSIKDAGLRGASVYTISQTASDKVTKSLADKLNQPENDLSFDTPDLPQTITDILVDLTRRETNAMSEVVANKFVDMIAKELVMLNNPHRRAGFRVLLAPDVPSVLIELGFLSNIEDEKLLSDPKWRKTTVELLARAIDEYRKIVMVGRS